jgi:hypothetical protein
MYFRDFRPSMHGDTASRNGTLRGKSLQRGVWEMRWATAGVR